MVDVNLSLCMWVEATVSCCRASYLVFLRDHEVFLMVVHAAVKHLSLLQGRAKHNNKIRRWERRLNRCLFITRELWSWWICSGNVSVTCVASSPWMFFTVNECVSIWDLDLDPGPRSVLLLCSHYRHLPNIIILLSGLWFWAMQLLYKAMKWIFGGSMSNNAVNCNKL